MAVSLPVNPRTTTVEGMVRELEARGCGRRDHYLSGDGVRIKTDVRGGMPQYPTVVDPRDVLIGQGVDVVGYNPPKQAPTKKQSGPQAVIEGCGIDIVR